MPTIKEIASIVGVSRGTVDRVINNRPGVNPETRDRILSVLEEMRYSPNIAGKNLSLRKKNFRIGYIHFQNENVALTRDLLPLVRERIQYLEELGITTELCPCEVGDEVQVIYTLDRLMREGVNGVIINAVNSELVGAKLKELTDAGIAVVTLGSDIDAADRLAFVGDDYYSLGRMAGNLTGLALGGHGKVTIITNFLNVKHHTQRIKGFRDKLSESYPQIQVIGPLFNYADDNTGYIMTREMLKQEKDLSGLFIECSNIDGICRAVSESGQELSLIAYENTASTRQFLKKGILSFLIVHDVQYLAVKPFDILYDYLAFNKKPDSPINYAPIDIRIAENTKP